MGQFGVVVEAAILKPLHRIEIAGPVANPLPGGLGDRRTEQEISLVGLPEEEKAPRERVSCRRIRRGTWASRRLPILDG